MEYNIEVMNVISQNVDNTNKDYLEYIMKVLRKEIRSEIKNQFYETISRRYSVYNGYLELSESSLLRHVA